MSDTGTLVVYVSALAAVQDEPGFNDVWLYDATTDTTRRLTRTRADRLETTAVFRDRTRITFFAYTNDEQSVIELDIATGEERKLIDPGGHVWSIDWDPSGTRLAGVREVEGGKQVQIYSARTGKTRAIFDLPQNVGRGGETADEIAATWSPDGTMISVVDTAADYGAVGDQEPPIYVISSEGETIADGITGTMARWSLDSKHLYFRTMYAADRSRWSDLDLGSGTTTRLAVSAPHQVYPAVSPDGRYLAFSDDEPDGKVRIFDLRSGDERVVASKAVGPIWLSDTSLAVTDVEPCGDQCGEGPQWRIAGRARLIDIDDESESRLRLHRTGPPGAIADVWHG